MFSSVSLLYSINKFWSKEARLQGTNHVLCKQRFMFLDIVSGSLGDTKANFRKFIGLRERGLAYFIAILRDDLIRAITGSKATALDMYDGAISGAGRCLSYGFAGQHWPPHQGFADGLWFTWNAHRNSQNMNITKINGSIGNNIARVEL